MSNLIFKDVVWIDDQENNDIIVVKIFCKLNRELT